MIIMEKLKKISWTFLLSQKQNVKIIMETKKDKLQLRFQKCFDTHTHNMAYLEIQGLGSIDSIKA